MRNFKKEIIDIIYKYQEDEKSSTGTTGEQIIYSCSVESISEDIISLIEKYQDDFNNAVEPAIRYLFKNHDPHTKIYIDYNIAELLQGQKSHDLNEEIPD